MPLLLFLVCGQVPGLPKLGGTVFASMDGMAWHGSSQLRDVPFVQGPAAGAGPRVHPGRRQQTQRPRLLHSMRSMFHLATVDCSWWGGEMQLFVNHRVGTGDVCLSPSRRLSTHHTTRESTSCFFFFL